MRLTCVCVCFVDDNDDYCGFIEHKIDENSVIVWCFVSDVCSCCVGEIEK